MKKIYLLAIIIAAMSIVYLLPESNYQAWAGAAKKINQNTPTPGILK